MGAFNSLAEECKRLHLQLVSVLDQLETSEKRARDAEARPAPLLSGCLCLSVRRSPCWLPIERWPYATQVAAAAGSMHITALTRQLSLLSAEARWPATLGQTALEGFPERSLHRPSASILRAGAAPNERETALRHRSCDCKRWWGRSGQQHQAQHT